MRLMNQATTKSGGEAAQSHAPRDCHASLAMTEGNLIYLTPPLEKGDLEGFLYEVMRDTINKALGLKELPQLKFIRAL